MFAGPRNRMPYFRWLGPTAIMPGFKQMVVKVNKRQESELTRSSTEGGGAAGMKSPSLNNASTGTDPRIPSKFNTTPNTVDSEIRTPINLPFYDNSAMPPSELITHLGQTFFTHLGCNYPFLQRDRFLRDLEEKQVDAILVDAVCALAARFSTHELLTQQKNTDGTPFSPAEYGSAFGLRAKASLISTFAVPSVAAVQAALLLAYNEFGESRDSGLWMYLGIAIRLAQDLGLQNLQGLKYKGMEGPTPRQVKRHSMAESDYDRPRPPPLKNANSSFSNNSEAIEDSNDLDEHMAVEQERVDTFWAIFLLDRVVASGTGRRSTLRDKDIEVSFPPLGETLAKSDWPQPFPALIRIVHLYGRVADLLNSIKEPSDVNAETSKRLASMESQVTNFYQGLSTRLHFDAVNFQYYMKAGEGTNFVLLHFWFHMLIVLLHQPTLLKTFEGKMLQLFPNSQQLSMSSAKTIADILSYSQLMDAKASLGNPFTTQPIYIAACAFLKETAEQTASSNAHSRATSPSRSSREARSDGARSGGTTPKGSKKYSVATGSIATPSGPRAPASGTVADRRSLAKHTLLATAASQHYQLCYKALQSLETYWGGTKYILTVLDQKFEGVGDPVLYTAEEGESSLEAPKSQPSFTTPGWRRRLSLGTQSTTAFGRDFLQGAEGEPGDHGKGKLGDHSSATMANLKTAIGWTLTGIMNSPSTNLAWHYPRDFNDGSLPAVNDHNTNHLAAGSNIKHVRSASGPSQMAPNIKSGLPAYQNSGSAVSDASLLLGLNNPYEHHSNMHSPNVMPFQSSNSTPNMHDRATVQQSNAYPPPTQPTQQPDMGPYPDMQPFGDMTIESQEMDMSMLGLDMMPWFDAPYASGPDMMGMFDTNVGGDASTGAQQQQS